MVIMIISSRSTFLEAAVHCDLGVCDDEADWSVTRRPIVVDF